MKLFNAILLIKNYLFKFLNTIFLLPYFMINFFFKVKIGKIKSSKLGHLVLDTLAFKHFIEKKNKSKNKYIIFNEKNIANTFFYNSIEKNIKVNKFSNFLNLIYNLSNNSFLKKFLIIRMEFLEKYYSEINIYNNFSKNFHFSENTNSNFKKLGIDNRKKFYLIHNRDSNYLKKTNNNFERHSIRNFSINNLDNSTKIISDEYSSVRVGREVEKITTDLNSIDYSSSKYVSDEMDLFLFKKSDFYIGSDAGIWALALLFNKPYSIINYRLYGNLHRFFNNNKLPILISRMYDIRTNKVLKFKDIRKKKYHLFTNSSQFQKNKISFHENSIDDISGLLIEISNLLSKKDISREEKELKSYFSRRFLEEFTNLDPTKFFINFGTNFIKNNLDLVN